MLCGSVISKREHGEGLDLEEFNGICKLPPNKKNDMLNSGTAFTVPGSKDF